MIVLHNIAIMNRDTFEPLPAGEILSVNDSITEDTDIQATVAGSLTRQHYLIHISLIR